MSFIMVTEARESILQKEVDAGFIPARSLEGVGLPQALTVGLCT